MGKKRVQNLKWATAHLSRRLGVHGTQAGCAGWGAGRRHATWARSLGCGLCTWCTQLVFDPV